MIFILFIDLQSNSHLAFVVSRIDIFCWKKLLLQEADRRIWTIWSEWRVRIVRCGQVCELTILGEHSVYRFKRVYIRLYAKCIYTLYMYMWSVSLTYERGVCELWMGKMPELGDILFGLPAVFRSGIQGQSLAYFITEFTLCYLIDLLRYLACTSMTKVQRRVVRSAPSSPWN